MGGIFFKDWMLRVGFSFGLRVAVEVEVSGCYASICVCICYIYVWMDGGILFLLGIFVDLLLGVFFCGFWFFGVLAALFVPVLRFDLLYY